MSLIKRMRRQQAVWWPVLGTDDTGAPTPGSPVQIQCRWVDVAEQFVTPQGVTMTSKSKVYVDRPTVAPQGWLWLSDKTLVNNPIIALDYFGIATLNLDEDMPADPRLSAACGQIQNVGKTPKLNNRETLYTCYL